MAFPSNPSFGDTHIEDNSTWTYNGDNWSRTVVGSANATTYGRLARAGGSLVRSSEPCCSHEAVERPFFQARSRHRPARWPGSANGLILVRAPPAPGARLEISSRKLQPCAGRDRV